jgi:hypothetical protein
MNMGGTELTPEERRKLSQRNWALAAILLAFVALVFIVTIIKLSANIAQHAAG